MTQKSGINLKALRALVLLASAALVGVAAPGVARAQTATPTPPWTQTGNNISNTNTGNVGVGTTAPAGKLDVKGSTADANATALQVRNSADANLLFVRNDGFVGLNTTAPESILHIADESHANNLLTIEKATDTTGFPSLRGSRARGTLANKTIVASGDFLYRFAARGWDGGAYRNAAQIDFIVDNTPGSSDMPGRIVFGTTSDGGSFPAERMRIDSAGNVGVGTTAPNYKFEVFGAPSRNTIGLTGDGDSVGYAGIRINAQTTTNIPNNRTSAFILSMRKDTWYGGDGSGPSFIIETGTKGGGFAAPFLITPTNDIILNSGRGAGGPAGYVPPYGNVGIGTHTPAYKLDVAGSVNAAGLCINGSCKSAWADVGGGQWASSGTNISSTNAGNVGVGVASPAAKLHVGGGGRLDGAGRVYLGAGAVQGARGLELVEESATTFSIRHHDPNVAWRDIALNPHGGNVGVATAAPAVKLAVGGAGVNVYQTDAWVEKNLHVQGPEALTQGGRGRLRVGSAWGYSGLYADGSSTGASNDLVLGASSGTVRVGPGGSAAQSLSVPNGNISASGSITGGTIEAKYQDVAEWVPSVQKLSAGTVVVLDSVRTNHVLASASAYDTKVAGVVSAEPGVILGVAGEGKLKVATTGRVKVRVDATRAPIRIGDLLVTSEVEGVAMRSVPVELGGRQMHAPGTIIGKALEPLEKGTGEILVLLSLQ